MGMHPRGMNNLDEPMRRTGGQPGDMRERGVMVRFLSTQEDCGLAQRRATGAAAVRLMPNGMVTPAQNSLRVLESALTPHSCLCNSARKVQSVAPGRRCIAGVTHGRDACSGRGLAGLHPTIQHRRCE